MQPIILDGPVGTEIERRGGDISAPLWSAKGLIDNPDMIKNIHIDYINAGANVITTNTFRTQERTFKKVGLKNYGKTITQLAAELAVEARKSTESKVKIAGSIAPLEDCYSPWLVPDISDLQIEHQDMADWLYDSGIDLFLIETMNSVKEATVALEIAQKYEIPVWVGMTVNNDGVILSGESWLDLIQAFSNFPDIIFVNCSSRTGTAKALKQLSSLRQNLFPELNLGFYPNYLFELEEGRSIEKLREELFNSIDEWMLYKPKVVGTCCGATPDDTAILKNKIDQIT